MKITERDERLLMLMAKFGAISTRDIRDRIFKSECYYRRRCLKLEVEGLVKRNKVLTYLTKKGVRYLESKGVENIRYVVKSDMLHKKRYAAICSMSFELENFNIIASNAIKRVSVNDDKKYRYLFKVVSRGGEEYYVYRVIGIKVGKNDNIEKKTFAKKRDIELLKRDILNTSMGYAKEYKRKMNAIIFFEDKESMGIYREGEQNLNLEKQILLPMSPRGFEIANEIIALDLHENTYVKNTLKSLGYEIKEKSLQTHTHDFYVNNKIAFNMISHDFNDQTILKNYLNVINSHDKICIICTKEQEEWYKYIYKNIQVLGIDV